MMGEVLTEIRMENKWHPIVMAVKLVVIFVLLFGGALLRGFPYSIVFFYSSVYSLDMILLKAPRIDFFLPRSGEEWYRMKWKKCLLVSGFYAGVVAGGYILNVAVTGRYHFDFVHISAIWIMFSLIFLIMLENRLHLEYNRYREDLDVLEEWDRNRLLGGVLLKGISGVMTFILIAMLCIVDFAEVDGLLFLQQKRYRILELLIYIWLIGDLLYMVKRSQEKMKSFFMDV